MKINEFTINGINCELINTIIYKENTYMLYKYSDEYLIGKVSYINGKIEIDPVNLADYDKVKELLFND